MNNKIIERKLNVGDSRIETYRGRTPEPPATSAPSRSPEKTGNAAFGANRGNFTAKQSSARGQASRLQAAHPAPAARAGGGGGGARGGGGGGSHGGGGGRH